MMAGDQPIYCNAGKFDTACINYGCPKRCVIRPVAPALDDVIVTDLTEDCASFEPVPLNSNASQFEIFEVTPGQWAVERLSTGFVFMERFASASDATNWASVRGLADMTGLQ